MYTFYFSLYLYWRVCGYVNDLICWQRGHLCKANVRRHQSFHHHGEPLRPKVSLERRVLRLLTAWHVSLGYVKASEVQCEVIMASQSFEKKCSLNISDLSSRGVALTSSRAVSRWSYCEWVSDHTYSFPLFFFQGMACSKVNESISHDLNFCDECRFVIPLRWRHLLLSFVFVGSKVGCLKSAVNRHVSKISQKQLWQC